MAKQNKKIRAIVQMTFKGLIITKCKQDPDISTPCKEVSELYIKTPEPIRLGLPSILGRKNIVLSFVTGTSVVAP